MEKWWYWIEKNLFNNDNNNNDIFNLKKTNKVFSLKFSFFLLFPIVFLISLFKIPGIKTRKKIKIASELYYYYEEIYNENDNEG